MIKTITYIYIIINDYIQLHNIYINIKVNGK